MGNKSRNALREWQEGNDHEIAAAWLEAPRQAADSGPGWRCTSVDEATAHPGSAATQRGQYLRNVVVMMTPDGAQYMGSSDGSAMYAIPAPPESCPDGAVYDD